ncbi:MAG: CBS domain-containing protein [Pyrinomonadaceae bacterium]
MMRAEGRRDYRDEYSQGSYDDRDRRNYGPNQHDRGWLDRASDEVSSWFGDTDAERRRERDEREGRSSDSYNESRNSRMYDSGRRGYQSHDDRDFARASEVMSRDVVRVHPRDSLRHAARLMAGYNCGALPVVDSQNRLIGMITDRDITVRGVAEHRDAGQVSVGAAMTDETFACHVNDTMRNCMAAMAKHQVRRMPIVDDHERVVGIISQADIARHAARRQGDGERRAVADVLRAVSEPPDRPYR